MVYLKNQTAIREVRVGRRRPNRDVQHFKTNNETGEEIGWGHFCYTCLANVKKGELKCREVAVKIVPKSKMTITIAIENVRREVKILRALSRHKNLVQFYDVYEDHD
ncbi:hypothetical protein AMTR_s00024p00245430 [Amborella trichopoda]|uniref:Protein kinase domain-containing protein n=1 Tax=Amborella trichopoda TaxID=13333 RepID=W1PVJ3_AMBTC|nr:hypothetical protein AMTR_s00024p00245430 [Amborella trichopoda]